VCTGTLSLPSLVLEANAVASATDGGIVPSASANCTDSMMEAAGSGFGGGAVVKGASSERIAELMRSAITCKNDQAKGKV